jgi:hypothetical protein
MERIRVVIRIVYSISKQVISICSVGVNEESSEELTVNINIIPLEFKKYNGGE